MDEESSSSSKPEPPSLRELLRRNVALTQSLTRWRQELESSLAASIKASGEREAVDADASPPPSLASLPEDYYCTRGPNKKKTKKELRKEKQTTQMRTADMWRASPLARAQTRTAAAHARLRLSLLKRSCKWLEMERLDQSSERVCVCVWQSRALAPQPPLTLSTEERCVCCRDDMSMGDSVQRKFKEQHRCIVWL